MKIVKKLSIGFLALIICFCSCFKYSKAFTTDNFYASITHEGNTLFNPWYDITFFWYNETSLGGSCYPSYPLTYSVYYQFPTLTPNSNGSHDEVYDDNLYLKYKGGLINNQEFIANIYRGTKDTLYQEAIKYRQAYSRFYGIEQSFNDRYVITCDFKGLSFADIPYGSVEFIASSTYLPRANVVYSYSYYDMTGNLLTDILNTTIDYKTDSVNVPIVPIEYTENSETYQSVYYRKLVDYNINISFDIEHDINEIVDIYCSYPIVDSVNTRKLIKILNTYDFIFEEAEEQGTINTSFTSWLVTAVGGFMEAEIFPGFSIGLMLSVIVSIPILIYILRLFMGG